MKIKELPQSQLKKGSTLKFDVGPFAVSVVSDFDAVYQEISKIYSEFTALPDNSFVDFEIRLRTSKSFIRRFVRRQCIFSLGGNEPFTPIGASQAFPMFEWGLNWCISSHSHQYLVIHAAVIEKDGVCVVMPAPPGSGKSTLTALLVYSGWRLLSDELTLIDTSSGLIQPLARPINLKNRSISVVQQAFPQAIHSDIVRDTHKGDVCLFKAPDNALQNINIKSKATHVIFPKYVVNTDIHAETISQEQVFFSVIENSFNYNILSLTGFNTLTNFVDGIQGYSLQYSDNKAAIEWFDRLQS